MPRSRRAILEKVVKMLRLARGAGTEAEAHTALTLAQKLMYAHGLEASEVEAHDDVEEEPIEDAVIDHASARLGWREYLAAVVAENFRCAYILSRARPRSTSTNAGVVRLVFVGRQHDVAAASEAYRAAAIAGETLAERYAAERDASAQDAARDAFLSGFLAGLDRRFRDNVQATSLVTRLDDAVLAHARSFTNADEAEGAALPAGDAEALRRGFHEGFAFGDPTKRLS